MIVCTDLVRMPQGTDGANFNARWMKAVSPDLTKMPGLRRYVHNRIIDRQQLASVAPRGKVDFDACEQFWFDNLADMQAALNSAPARQASAEVDKCGAVRSRLTILQNVVVAPPSEKPMLKRMSTLRRREGVSFLEFQQEWFDLHAVLLKRLPHVGGYIQNLVLDRVDMNGRSIDQDTLPVDAIVELWFPSVEAISDAFAQPVARTLQAHGLEFISEISTFLVEPTQIV